MTTTKDVKRTFTIHGDTFTLKVPQMYDKHGKECFNEIIANIDYERANDYFRARNQWVPNNEISNIRGILSDNGMNLAKEIGMDKETLDAKISCDMLIPPKAEKKLEYVVTHLYYQGDIKDGNV